MPELPEAETIVRGLRPTLRGRRIAEADVLRPDVLRQEPDRFRERVRGGVVRDVERRGKNVVMAMEDGSVILVNLGMTGRLLPRSPGEPPTSHPAVRFHLAGETGHPGLLVYDDVRRFGAVEALDPPEWRERSASLGPEPFDPGFGPGALARGLGRSRTPVRSWLLDQRRVAGIGNIYANEALHRAGIHPRRGADSLSEREAVELHRALRAVLAEAIRAGGTTIRDYRNASGAPGEFATELAAYGREGEPCTRCGTPIRRIVFGGRSAFLCPACQPEEDA